MKRWLVMGVLAASLAGCAHTRYRESFERLCLEEHKPPGYCEAWADVEATKLRSQEKGRYTTGVIIPIQ